MNGHTIARTTAAAAALGIGAALTMSAPALADPAPPAPSGLDSGLDSLVTGAGVDPLAQAGVGALTRYVESSDVASLRDIGSVFTPFTYAAPTFGCGTLAPITTIIAAATTSGQGASQDLNVEPGTLRFSATPAHSGVPLASGLVVAWVNVNNGASGIVPLDDRTEYNLPSLSKTVASGPGTVLASMWGVIDYPGSSCTMTPTVGLFTVPDQPLAPPPAPAPAQAPAGVLAPGPEQVAPEPADIEHADIQRADIQRAAPDA
ncbi:hypothetical protein [Nocardia callitridis]|uniref:Uncharacterized protein n=1 Tax=Nocardia callitridis TaxID=648753 RepID=A0ABP9JTJ3_9NOCA